MFRHVDRLLLMCMQLTGGKIGDRLLAEAETNLAINVIPGLSESFEVQGRGELQLGLCFCQFLLSVSSPLKMDINIKYVGKNVVISISVRNVN